MTSPVSLDTHTLIVHESLSALDRLEPSWRSMTLATTAPFQTFTWNAAWYSCFTRGVYRPILFELRHSSETVAILPCYRDGKVIRLAADRICDYQDVIARDAGAVVLLLAHLRDWLDTDGRGFHFHFDRLSSRGLLHSTLINPETAPHRSLRFEKAGTSCPYTNLHEGLDSYLAALPRKSRGDLRHSLNRFDREAADAKVRIYRDYEIRVEDLWKAAAFHVEHFRQEGNSPFSDHRLIDLFGQIAKDPEVGFQLSLLKLHGDLIAIDFGFVRGGCYYGYLSAFDESRARIAPSKCLLLKRIDTWVDEDRVHTLDFLAGDESYKRRFTGASDYKVSSVHLMTDDLTSRARRIGLESGNRVRRIAKRLLGREDGLAR